MLVTACGVARNKFPHYTKIVGIAIDAPKFAKGNSEDFLLLECSEWTEEQRQYYEEANEDFEFFETKNLQQTIVKTTDFPLPAYKANRRVKVGRNEPCPCGSGKKFKKCCLRFGR